MYKKPFYITGNFGNNNFSYEKRKNKKIFIPSLISGNFNDIKIGENISFEDFDFNGNLISVKGLKNFYKLNWNKKTIYFFDNHNHAFYFWCLAKNNGIVGEKNILYHIDEHSDMREPKYFLQNKELNDLNKVFEYTNFKLNVGNYIIPALKTNLISKVVQLRNTWELENYLKNKIQKKGNIILNLDLDFFEPNLDFIPYDLKKKVILDIAEKANLITVSTSPFFINQKLAVKTFKDLFYKLYI